MKKKKCMTESIFLELVPIYSRGSMFLLYANDFSGIEKTEENSQTFFK
jgi:hypothetical protein